MARMFSGTDSVRDHWSAEGCQPMVSIVPMTSERDCADCGTPRGRDCDVQHARICDCGLDMRATRKSCEHGRVTTWRCTCGRTREYGGWIPPNSEAV